MPAADALHASYSFSSGGLHNSLHLLSRKRSCYALKRAVIQLVQLPCMHQISSQLGLYSSMHSLFAVLIRILQMLCMHCALSICGLHSGRPLLSSEQSDWHTTHPSYPK